MDIIFPILGGLNPLISNVGEGFINQGYIVVAQSHRLNIKGLSYFLHPVFSYGFG